MNLRKRLTEMVKEVCENPEINDVLKENVDLSKEYMFDSILIIELIGNIEDEFQIEFSFDDLDLENIYQFDALVRIVESQIEA